MLLVALPAWRHQAQREKEAELIFRGQQYARAIGLYQRKLAGSFPPNIDVLVEQRFLRKKYKDPITGEDFVPIYANTQEGVEALRQVGGVEITAERATLRTGRGGDTLRFEGNVTIRQAPGSPASPLQSPASGMQGGRGATQPGTRLAGGAGGIVGVMSKSTAESIRLYNGRNRYNQWIFTYVAAGQPGEQIGPGLMAPGVPGRGLGPAPPPTDQRGSGRQSGFPRGRGGSP